MKKLIPVNLAFFLCLTCLSCSKTNTDAAWYEQEISRLGDSILTAQPSIPGLLIGVWDGDKNLAYTVGKGYSDPNTKELMNPDYHFRIGSNTKSFVVTAILQLVDEGKLSLNDRLSKFFPDFPRAGEVTISQLCTMESGIFNYTNDSTFFMDLYSDPGKSWTPDDLLAHAAPYPYSFEPGKAYGYSNTNTVLLGRIAEMLTGKPLGTLLNEKFFSPLGLTHTSFALENKMPVNYIKGWGTSDWVPIPETTAPVDVSEYFNQSWAWACGNNVSTLQDLKIWLEKLIDGSMISDSLQQKRFTSHFMDAGFTYGYGIFTIGNGFWGHNGGIFGYNSVMMRMKGKDCTIIILANTLNDVSNGATLNLFAKIAKLLYP